MSVRVGINGFGRIGRNFFRSARKRDADRRDRRGQRPGRRRRRWPTCSSTTRCSARSTHDVEAADGAHSAIDGDELKLLNERDPAALAVGRSRRRRRPRVDRPLHQARQGAAAPGRRRAEGRHLGAGHRPRRDRRPRRQRRLLRPRAAPHHLERLVHDELRRAVGQGPQRRVGDRVGVHDDDPRVHERPADPRSAAQRPPARAGRGDQPHPDVDGRRQGDRRRDPRAAGQGGRHLRARPGLGRLDRRPRRHARRRGDFRRGERALPRGSRHGRRSKASSSTRTSRSSPRTSSATPSRRSSTAT